MSSETKSETGAVIWAAPAIVTDIGEGEDGHDIVGLKMYGRDAALPVNLPSEARQIGAHLGRRVTVALLAAAEEGQSLEEQLVWHRCEVDRLRELLAAKPAGEGEARLEVGRSTVVITMRRPDAEHAVVARAAEVLAEEHVARRIAEANKTADVANKNSAQLARVMRGALLIIDAVVDAEKRGVLQVSATRGTRWDDLRAFAADPHVREWLRVTAEDSAHVEAAGGEPEGEEDTP